MGKIGYKTGKCDFQNINFPQKEKNCGDFLKNIGVISLLEHFQIKEKINKGMTVGGDRG